MRVRRARGLSALPRKSVVRALMGQDRINGDLTELDAVEDDGNMIAGDEVRSRAVAGRTRAGIDLDSSNTAQAQCF